MRLDFIDAENFRGFERLKLELHPEFNLIIGQNGAGKTSILDALAVALGGWLLGFPDVPARNFRRDDARLRRVELGGVPNLERCVPTSVIARGKVLGGRLQWQRFLSKRRTSAHADDPMRARSAQAQQAVSEGQPIDLPVLAYYGTGRLWLQHREWPGARTELGSRLQGYDACLDPASDHRRFESWMQWRETARLEKLAADPTATNGKLADPHLEAVQEAARNCIEGAKRIFYSFQYKEIRVEFENGQLLPFALLSDGYRNLIAVAADIAWRAVRLNPHHGRDAAALAEGVVLIDEIDLHLHPAWQRRVIGDLRRTFPKVQFVATTHSPQVVSSAKSEWIRLVTPDGQVRPIQHGEGRDSNSLLEDVFGVPERPVETSERLGRLFDLIDEMAWERAEASWADLRAFLGPNDPDVVRARTTIDLERGLGLTARDSDTGRE